MEEIWNHKVTSLLLSFCVLRLFNQSETGGVNVALKRIDAATRKRQSGEGERPREGTREIETSGKV